MSNNHTLWATDGTFDFSSGVNCARTPTVKSQSNPYGLPRNAFAWLTNGTVRGGGVYGRPGWNRLIEHVSDAALYQGGWMYEPTGENPYLIISLAGNLIRIQLDSPYTVTNLSLVSGLQNNPSTPLGFMCQGEDFLIAQSGDALTLPLFWDGNTLRRSNGITTEIDPAQPNVSELPASGPMCYYASRLWYAQDRIYCAGDIARGAAGTTAYARRDSILRVTENPLAFGGDGFSVPTAAGNIRALTYPANIDTTLGQGPLLIGTRKTVYSLTVPVSRADWTAANDNQPLQVVAQMKWGMVNDRGVVQANGDLFYQTLEPAVRSFAFARRSYGQWANLPISQNVRRITRRNDRALLRYCTGMNLDNRIFQSGLPFQTPYGVVHKVVLAMDLDPLSSLEEQLPPIWEGHSEGLNILQLFEGDFGGLQRGFAVVLSEDETSIDIWEFSREDLFQNGDNRITWSFESPAWTWADSIGERNLKKLVGGEMYFDEIFGTSEVTVEFRPDSQKCWLPWSNFQVCSSRNAGEAGTEPEYPPEDYVAGYQPHKTLPHPPIPCMPGAVRPANIGLQFQVRVTVKGSLRIRSLMLFAEPFERSPYHGLVC